MSEFNFDQLATADLIIDAIYMSKRGANPFAGEPLNKLIPGLGNRGGFNKKRSNEGNLVGLVLKSTGDEIDWPDELDPLTGIFTYFGDNRKPGKALTDTKKKGNLDLETIFDYAHGDINERRKCPLILIFQKYGKQGDYSFKGLAVPGSEYLFRGEDLVAIWRTSNGRRFQNYRAKFTILDVNRLDGNWVREVFAKQKLDLTDSRMPKVFLDWMNTGTYKALMSMPTSTIRSKEEQLPSSSQDSELLHCIYSHYQENPFGFEKVAAEIWKMSNLQDSTYDLTRHYRDGGRDALGFIHLGPKNDPIKLSFALEAKCYKPGNSVGVKETSRLISRIKHREFGIIVTTSYVDQSAYKEIRQDGHPVVIISGSDICNILKNCGVATRDQVLEWLYRIDENSPD
jgi:Restriction endonuclease AspBHI N-terminal/Restriction endonuclease